MIRGKENLIEWVKSTPNVKQIQIRKILLTNGLSQYISLMGY